MNTYNFAGKRCAHCQQELNQTHAATWRAKLDGGIQRFFCNNGHHSLWMAQEVLALDQPAQNK